MASKIHSHDLKMLQGATFKLTIPFTDATGTTLIGVTDTISMEIRVGKSKTSELILNCTPYFTISTVAAILTLPASLTNSLLFDIGYYDVKLTQTGGVIRRILQGQITLDTAVTA